MANAKRASMREGPLAALFRKTEDEEEPQAGSPSASAGHEVDSASRPSRVPAPAHPRETGLPHPALSASAPTPSEPVAIASPRERLRHAFS